MQLTKAEARPSHTITVITKKRRSINGPAKMTSYTFENQQPGILGSGNRFAQDELRNFGNR